MKKLFLFLTLGILALSVISASMLIPSNDNAKEHAKAAENSPMISETDSGEWGLERVDFIHYAKPNNSGKPNKGGKGGNACFKLMGVKWKSSPVDYTINPTNSQGLDESFIVSTIAASAETWDEATSMELVNDVYTVDNGASYGIQNFENVIDFGSLNAGIIGVTSVWYTRRGKQIVEADMRLNINFNWGDAALDSSLMDLENIATHEMGHVFGMDDIYTESCNTVTMFGYSGYGETSKRSLEQPDVDGIVKMYGL